MKVLAAIALLVLVSCGTMGTPEAVFDTYIQAYADGDAKKMWELSAPSVHADTAKVRAYVLTILAHPDPVVRIQIEGKHAITKEEVQAMDTHGFFIWAVYASRRQLGARQVRRIVETVTRKYVESMGPNNVNVVYHETDDASPKRMHLRRIYGRWYVQFNPFQAAMPSNNEKEAPVVNVGNPADESEGTDTPEEPPKSEPTPFPWEE
jgi:hypothetical protein